LVGCALVENRRGQTALELQLEIAEIAQLFRRPALEEVRIDGLARHLPGDGLLSLLAAVQQRPPGLVREGTARAVEAAMHLVGMQKGADHLDRNLLSTERLQRRRNGATTAGRLAGWCRAGHQSR